MAKDEPTPRRNGKLAIPMPFEDALRAATELSADKLPPPLSKQKSRRKRPAKS